jgi:ATP-binding cassette subfamily C protein LapB
MSLRIAAGEKVVIIGRVGSGKTTLQRLLLGLYPPGKGTITVDGIDLRQIDPADLRRNIGYVAQDPLLFYGTLRDNIAIAAPFADDAAVLAAAEVAGLTPFVNAHPQGFDMLIGERGDSLSGGQRQSVAIARALLYDPAVLILDEPTASMDPVSEQRLLKHLQELTVGKTTLLITHKGVMLSLVDKIILIDRGRIIAYGPKDEITAKLQSRQYDRA